MEKEPTLKNGLEKINEKENEFWERYKAMSDTIEKLKLDLKKARELAEKAQDAKNEKEYARHAEEAAILADKAIEAIEEREHLLNSRVKPDSKIEKELE